MEADQIPSHGCEHEQQELRRITRNNGTRHFVMQCLICGKERNSVGRGSLEFRKLVAPPPDFDHTIAAPYWGRRVEKSRERTRRKREEEQETRRSEYDTYINSEAWQRKRAARLALDGALCQARLDGCTSRATDVHHWTYQHFGNEPLFELVSVCRVCHDQITEMDRRDREGGSDERIAS